MIPPGDVKVRNVPFISVYDTEIFLPLGVFSFLSSSICCCHSRTVLWQTPSWMHIPSCMDLGSGADLSPLFRTCSEGCVAMIGRDFDPDPVADGRGVPTRKLSTEQHWVPVRLMFFMHFTIIFLCQWSWCFCFSSFCRSHQFYFGSRSIHLQVYVLV